MEALARLDGQDEFISTDWNESLEMGFLGGNGNKKKTGVTARLVFPNVDESVLAKTSLHILSRCE